MISYANNSFHSQPLSLSADKQELLMSLITKAFFKPLSKGDAECGAH